MKNFLLLLAVISVFCSSLPAPMQSQERGRVPGETVIGKVTAVAADSVTVAPAKGGDPVTVKVGDETRILKDRQPAKIGDIKAGDTVMARGSLAGSTLQARMVGIIPPEMAERMQQGGFGRGPGQGEFKPEDWGKTFVAGQIKAIHETTVTIARPDNQQTLNIEVDENTSFKKGRESITLADIKADDRVFASGEIKNGVFVAKELRVGGGRMFMGQPGSMGQPGASGDQPAPNGEKPPTPPKN